LPGYYRYWPRRRRCGGTSANLDIYGVDTADGDTQARVFVQPNRPVLSSTPGVYARAGAQATEDATWSAKRDTATGYGIAVFDVDPGHADGQTSITVTHYHALGAGPVNQNTGAKGAHRRLHRLRDLHPGPPACRPPLRLAPSSPTAWPATARFQHRGEVTRPFGMKKIITRADG